MSIEPASFNVPARMTEEDLPARYRQPSIISEAGQLDRRHEAQHVVRMRDMQRDAIESAGRQAKQLVEMESWMVARGHALSEAKYRLMRDHKESQFLAGDDPVLQAKYAILDDEHYRQMRLNFEDWR